jgi:serine/threonine protein kinase
MAFSKSVPNQPALLTDFCPLPQGSVIRLAANLLHQISDSHERGKLLGDIDPAKILLIEGDQLQLSESSSNYSPSAHDELSNSCPPELQELAIPTIPLDISLAAKELERAGANCDPRRIDLYQWAAVVIRMATGQKVAAYLNSPRIRGQVPAKLNQILDQALGYNPMERANQCRPLLMALALILDNQPNANLPDESKQSSPQKPTNSLNPEQSDSDQTVGSQSKNAAMSSAPNDLSVANDEKSTSTTKPVAVSDDITHKPLQLGPYRILHRIGSGGMGEVYSGRDAALDRNVAIKVLPPTLSRYEECVRRFHVEASAIAKITHPNIIPVYSVGHEQDWHYFVMPLIEGGSLADRLANHEPISLHEAVSILEQSLQGLAAAHAHGLVHRDIKPGNILLDSRTGRVLLADFGLVRILDQSTQLTASGVILGTLDYIAPEQARGKPADVRADLYSLGVVAYQLLTGALPFQSSTLTGMLFQQAYETPPSLHKSSPHIPEQLASLVHRLLAKDPDERPATAAEVLNELRRLRALGIIPEGMNASSLFSLKIPNPVLSDKVFDLTAQDWERQAESRVAKRFRRGPAASSPKWSDTQKQVEEAVEAQQRRRDDLARLAAEANSALNELRAQLEIHLIADAELGLKQNLVNSQDLAELQSQRAVCQAEIQKLRQLIDEHQKQASEISILQVRADAELTNQRAQRDILLARLQMARARGAGSGKQSRSRRSLVMLFLACAILGCILIWQYGGISKDSGTKTPVSSSAIATRTEGINELQTQEDVERAFKATKKPPTQPVIPREKREPLDSLGLTPFKMDDVMREQINSSPLLITDFQPQTAPPGAEITLTGRGFTGVERVAFFDYSYGLKESTGNFDRAANFQILSDQVLKVRVPDMILDDTSALIGIASRDTYTITMPPNPVVIDEIFPRGYEGYDRIKEADRALRHFRLVKRGGKYTFGGWHTLTFVQKGGRCENGVQFLQNDAFGEHGFQYCEPKAQANNFFENKRWRFERLVPSPVSDVFRYQVSGLPPDSAKGPPVITGFSPPEVTTGEILTLHGSNFSGVTHVFAVGVPSRLANAVKNSEPQSRPSDVWSFESFNRCNAQIISDREIRIMMPILGSRGFAREDANGFSLLPILLNAYGVTYVEPPDVHHVQREQGGSNHAVTIIDSGVVALNGGAVITILEKDAFLEKNFHRATFLKPGAKMDYGGGGGSRGAFWEKNVKETTQLESKKDDFWFEVPKIVANPLPTLPEFAPRYQIMPRQAVPVARLFDSFIYKDQALFEKSFTKSLLDQLKSKDLKLEYEQAKTQWFNDLKATNIPNKNKLPLRFFFIGDEKKGEIRVDYKEQRLPYSIHVVLENDRWKIDQMSFGDKQNEG